MKRTLSTTVAVVIFVAAAVAVSAAPFNAFDKNPNVVAYHETGIHAIVGKPEIHEGKDIVMKSGNSGNFQQWFYGTSASEGLHGEHSVWNISRNGTCPNTWTLVVRPYPAWGSYLTAGVDYCVHTNVFQL